MGREFKVRFASLVKDGVIHDRGVPASVVHDRVRVGRAVDLLWLAVRALQQRRDLAERSTVHVVEHLLARAWINAQSGIS